jgi:hypothetical protein
MLTTSARALRRKRVLPAVVLLLLSLACGSASAQPAPATPLPRQFFSTRDPGRIAHVAAIAGVVGAGLMLGGTLAIELADRPKSEDVTRGLHLGFTALAAPLVAWASYSVRSSERTDGSNPLRAMGWGFYTGAIAFGVAHWYDALHGERIPSAYGALYGTLAILSLLPQCFDAYLAARSARVSSLVATPAGVMLRF